MAKDKRMKAEAGELLTTRIAKLLLERNGLQKEARSLKRQLSAAKRDAREWEGAYSLELDARKAAEEKAEGWELAAQEVAKQVNRLSKALDIIAKLQGV